MAEQKPQRKDDKEKAEKGASSIVRLSGKDVNGALSVKRALSQVKGVGINMSNSLSHAIEAKLNIPGNTSIGSLSEEQIIAIEGVIKDPLSNGIPSFMINHRKFFETGKDMHFVSNDLLLITRQDVNRDVALRTWRGFRHQYGQKVRGQRTRSTGRTGATVGVMKKAAKEQLAAATKGGESKATAPTAKPAAEAK